MADSKITALASIGTGTDPANDQLVIVDVSDVLPTGMATTGTTKRVGLNQLLSSSPTATGAFSVTGLVTAGSATITGDLTVDTSTLKVDSANDRVGIGTASPAAGAKLGVLGATSVSTSDYIGSSTYAARFIGSSNGASSGISLLTNSAAGQPTPASIHATPIADFRSALTATYSADNTGAGYFAVNRFNPSGSNTLEHYKIDNAGVATWSNVGGVAGTAMTLNATGLGVGVTPSSGKGALQLSSGINFPATQVASSDVNTLDDYEEGTWTGTLKGSTTDPTVPVTATGRYTKIGRQVLIEISFTNVSTVGAAGAISIAMTGLPGVTATRSMGNVSAWLGATFTGTLQAMIIEGTSVISLVSSVSNAANSDATHNAGTGRYFWITASFTV